MFQSDRKSTRLNSSHLVISYAVFCLKKKIRRDAVQPDIEAERKKIDEIEAWKSYCSRRIGGATCDDKSAHIYARFDKNDRRIQPAEFYRFHDAEVNTFGYFCFFFFLICRRPPYSPFFPTPTLFE